MNIKIEWQEPIQLTQYKNVLISALPKGIENLPGFIFFPQVWRQIRAFLHWPNSHVEGTIKAHLGETKLDNVLREVDHAIIRIKAGERYFHFGYYKSTSTPKTKKCLKIVEKYLVRTALAEEFMLLNKQLTAFKTDHLTFSGNAKARGIYAKEALVEA